VMSERERVAFAVAATGVFGDVQPVVSDRPLLRVEFRRVDDWDNVPGPQPWTQLRVVVPEDWHERVASQGLARLTDTSGAYLLCLSARPWPDVPEGAEKAWQVRVCTANGGPYNGWAVRFGGRVWFSAASASSAFERACRAVQKELSA
jgi:hypothetical protein